MKYVDKLEHLEAAYKKENSKVALRMAMLTLFTFVILQQTIFYSTGIKFHITHVRKIIHQYCMSAKTAQKYNINHASVFAVQSWQQRMKKRLLSKIS